MMVGLASTAKVSPHRRFAPYRPLPRFPRKSPKQRPPQRRARKRAGECGWIGPSCTAGKWMTLTVASFLDSHYPDYVSQVARHTWILYIYDNIIIINDIFTRYIILSTLLASSSSSR